MSVDFEFKGYNRVQNKLRKLASVNAEIIDPVMQDWAKRLRATLKGKAYPPKRKGQKYRRTGKLANSWFLQKVKAAVYQVKNRASYAHFVVSDKQAWMHRGRWWRATTVVNKEAKELPDLLTARIREIVEDDG